MNTTDTTFSIARFQELVLFLGTHHVAIEDKPVRVICIDLKTLNGHAVIALAENDRGVEQARQYTPDGRSIGTISRDEYLTIVPNGPKSLGWIGVYVGYESGSLCETSLYSTLDQLLSTGFTFEAIHEFKEGDGLTTRAPA